MRYCSGLHYITYYCAPFAVIVFTFCTRAMSSYISSGNVCLSVELQRKYEQVNMSGMHSSSLCFGLYKCSSKNSSLNSKSKQERTNTSLLSVNIKTNTKADKQSWTNWVWQQTSWPNNVKYRAKEIKGREQTRASHTSQERGVQFLFCTATNANNVSHTNSRHINAGELKK